MKTQGGPRGKRQLQITTPPLPPANAPLDVAAELHYVYSLLMFSDAGPSAAMSYTEDTECARLHYERDGVHWLMVLRKDDD